MANESVSMQMRRLQTGILKVLATVDTLDGGRQVRQLVTGLKRDLADARLDVRDYEYAETRAEQAKHGVSSRQRLASAKTNMLAASQYNIFSAVEVAQLSAQIDQLTEALA